MQRNLGRGPAPWLEQERLRLSRRAGRDANRIRKALADCGVKLSRKTERIPGDLGDMLEVFRHFKLSLDSLASKRKRPTRKFARAILEQIRNDIYIDLDDHLRGLRKSLDQAIDELDEALGSRWDRLIQEFGPLDPRPAKARGDSPRARAAGKKESFSSILAWSRKRH